MKNATTKYDRDHVSGYDEDCCEGNGDEIDDDIDSDKLWYRSLAKEDTDETWD